MSFTLQDDRRRFANLVRIGRIKSVDTQNARAIVDTAGNTTAPLPWLTAAGASLKTWRAPAIGEQVLLIAPAGDLAQAVIIGGIFSATNPAPDDGSDTAVMVFGDGAVISYRPEAHTLTAALPAGGKTAIHSDGGVAITGDVTVTGAISASGNIHSAAEVSDAVRTMSGDRAIFNGHTHNGGLVPPPDQQQ